MANLSNVLRDLKSLRSKLNSSYDARVDSGLAKEFNELARDAEDASGKDFGSYLIRNINEEAFKVQSAGDALDAALSGYRDATYPKQKLLEAVNNVIAQLE